MEDGLDERSRELEKVGQFLFDERVPVLILVARNLEILLDLWKALQGQKSSADDVNVRARQRIARTHLEEVLLIAQALFLLLPQLVERVVVTVKVDQLVSLQTHGSAGYPSPSIVPRPVDSLCGPA